MVLILLIAAVVFCYSVVRLSLAIVRPPKEEDVEVQLPRLIIAGGYANPATPIPVTLTRDEEAVGVQSEAAKVPPPAYGLWRESVVCSTMHQPELKTCLLSTEGRPEPPFLAAKRGSGTRASELPNCRLSNCKQTSVIYL